MSRSATSFEIGKPGQPLGLFCGTSDADSLFPVALLGEQLHPSRVCKTRRNTPRTPIL